jgi:hypothetical protein
MNVLGRCCDDDESFSTLIGVVAAAITVVPLIFEGDDDAFALMFNPFEFCFDLNPPRFTDELPPFFDDFPPLSDDDDVTEKNEDVAAVATILNFTPACIIQIESKQHLIYS